LSKEGVGKIYSLGEIADWEKELVDACVKDLASNIKKVNLWDN
jgi:malate/lactate dehydrogenase